MLIVNPGSGPAESATVEQAEANIAEFVADLGLAGVTAARQSEDDYGDGRFCWRLSHEGRGVDVQMPGVGMGHLTDEDPWSCLRLYVDDSSWLWGIAVGIVGSVFHGEMDDED